MKVEYIQPFLTAALEVLKAEFGVEARRGTLRLESNHYTTQEATVLIGVTGEVEGTALYGTSTRAVRNMVGAITGKVPPIFDELAESAFAELGNIISGRAAALFEQEGRHCRISPPTVLIGWGTIISNVDIERLVIPLHTSLGDIEIAVALRER